MKCEKLNKAAEIAGSKVKLARLLGVQRQAFSSWRRVPIKHCPSIERITGGAVRCEELRPDVDWGVLRTTTPQETP